MEFRYQCFVVRHVCDRVTVTPLTLPHLALHASGYDRAVEDLHLALDDRITRAHPRRVTHYVDQGRGALRELFVAALPVWNAGSIETRTMRIAVIVSPGHKPYVEVRSPRLDMRVWLEGGDDVLERAAPLFAEHLRALKEDRRLALRREGVEELVEVTVQAAPTKLSALRRRELHTDERAPPAPDREVAARPGAEGDDAEDDDEATRDEDDFDEELGIKRPAPPKKPKKKKVTTPTLDKLAVPLHALAKDGELDRAWELDALMETLLKRLSAPKPEPLVIVGPAGIGKTAAVHELASRLAETSRDGKRRLFFDLPPSRWIAGEGFFGDWQQQSLDVIEEAHRAEAIVYIGHVIDVLDAGKSAHSDHNLAQVLGPALAAREVVVIAEATPEEWARLERRNLGFAQSWSVVRMEEPSPDASRRILAKVAESAGREKEVEVDAGAVDAAVALARRFWPYGALVGNAVAFLRRLVGSRVHARAKRVTGADAIEQFGAESGIPRVLLRDDIALDPDAVRDFLKARVMGQGAAVARLAEVVSVIKAGLADPKKPVATLFFAGPTGVGKTELSKALAEFVFGSRDRLVRLDMGEYATHDALERLLGEDDAPGHLTAAVRRQPFCVVLFDEVEKAHPVVFDALLGVLGEGRLTDSSGRFTDFRNAVIIMTSNLGADTLRAGVGFGQGAAPQGAAARAHYVAEAERFFRPELFNRIDDFIVFDPLGAEVLRSIVVREVDKIAARDGLWRHEVALEVDDASMELLARRGFDPRYGARPLKRTLERELVVPLGNHLADHPNKGAVRMGVTVEDDVLALRATTVPGRDESVSRAVFQALEGAGKLRSEVRRWGRSRLTESLRGQVNFFLKASRGRGYWKEKALAEEEARRNDFARRLLDELAAVTTQAEALEDLAFEAWYTRAGASAEALQSEMVSIRKQFEPIRHRLFATMYPQTPGVVLYLQAGRNAWHHVSWFICSYVAWARAHELTTKAYTCLWVPPEERPGTHKDDPVASWRWREHMPNTTESPLPTTAALAISGDVAQFLFAAEHGVQRILDGGSDAVVRVCFQPRVVGHVSHLWHPKDLADAMPGAETRRFSVSKSTVKDARTQTEHPYTKDGFDCTALFEDYVTHRVFGADAEPWQ